MSVRWIVSPGRGGTGAAGITVTVLCAGDGLAVVLPDVQVPGTGPGYVVSVPALRTGSRHRDAARPLSAGSPLVTATIRHRSAPRPGPSMGGGFGDPAVGGGDSALGHAAGQAERVADREHNVASQAFRVAEPGRLHAGRIVGADHR